MTLDRSLPHDLNPADFPSPCFIVDERLLARNLAVLADVQRRSGARILLALKGFSCWATFPLLARELKGCCASSVHEARLAREEFGGEVHAFAAAWKEAEIRELATLADHMSFNSVAQFERFTPLLTDVSCGLRINPRHSEGHTPIYDPCAPGSRLGIARDALGDKLPAGVRGLHFHTLCEHNFDALQRTWAAVEAQFGGFLDVLTWLNLGGGHHITRADYDVDGLVRLVTDIRESFGLTVYLEPGEAVALDCGVLTATVLDVVTTELGPVAIVDASAAAHMPDVLEMPYTPRAALLDGGQWTMARDPQNQQTPGIYTRLAGASCLAGDVIGGYSFPRPLATGDRLAFMDMAIYSMVKTNTFNGLKLPSIAVIDESGAGRVVREFGYGDFKTRLS